MAELRGGSLVGSRSFRVEVDFAMAAIAVVLLGGGAVLVAVALVG